MWRIIFLFAVTLQNILCAPQFVSLKDGKVGVNFGGYHAEAGLGGILTGNAAHGGLSASAGTPHGQEAAAGLGGLVNGRAAGGAFAGATAGGNVGASAGLGGVAGGEFSDSGLGAEAHTGGVSHSVVSNGGGGFQISKHIAKVAQPAAEFGGRGDFYVSGNSEAAVASSGNVNVAEESAVIQRVKHPKKYPAEFAPENTVVVEKRIEIPTVQAQVDFEAQAAPKVHAAQVETVQELAPVKQTPVVATAAIETAPQQPFFNFQKSFGFNAGGGGYAQAPAAPVAPAPEYFPQTFVYRKHFRPWHHQRYLQKHYAPVIYQPLPVPQYTPVVEKRKQVYVQAAPPPLPAPAVGSGGFSGSFQGGVDTGSFFDSIFNIPIATLKAVNGLLNTGVRASGGIEVQKSGGLAVQKSGGLYYG